MSKTRPLKTCGPEDTLEARPSPPQRLELRRYLQQSRGLFNSLMLIAPIFLLYQTGIIIQLTNSPSGAFSLNGADWFTSNILRLLNGSLALYTGFVVTVAVGFGALIRRLKRHHHLDRAVFGPILVESTVYALLFGSTIHFMMGLTGVLASFGVLSGGGPPSSIWMKAFHSLGAGFNEEILFRLGLLGGIVSLGKFFKLHRLTLIVSAFIISSAAFSGFHYIGSYADVFTINSFMFRFLAGLLLSGIYWWRGLAVAVYTHSIYDLYFFLFVQG